jgi:hypothetical protein
MKKYLLLIIVLCSLLFANPSTLKIVNELSKIVLDSNVTTPRTPVDKNTGKGFYIFPAAFDNNDNLWFFWDVFRNQSKDIDKHKSPPHELGVFYKKLNRNGEEIISKKLLYKGMLKSVPSFIFVGPDNYIYFEGKDRGQLEIMDSLGNIIAKSEKLGSYLFYPYIWFDTLNNKIFFLHGNQIGGADLHTLDKKTLEILNVRNIAKDWRGEHILGKTIPLPPNLPWHHRLNRDRFSKYEVERCRYVATEWLKPETIIVCGANNIKQGFVHRIDLKNLSLVDSDTFDFQNYTFNKYDRIYLPKAQIVKGKDDGWWIFMPLRNGEENWINVFKLNNNGKLVKPKKTINKNPKDFDKAPNNVPKQAFVKKITSETNTSENLWELEIDFFGFDIDGNLYYYKYQKKR